MTVAELIEQLQTQPGDLQVYMRVMRYRSPLRNLRSEPGSAGEPERMLVLRESP